MVEVKKRRPIHETILDLLRSSNLRGLAVEDVGKFLLETELPEGHQEYIMFWEVARAKLPPDKRNFGILVLEDLRRQKTEAEAKLAEAAFVRAMAHQAYFQRYIMCMNVLPMSADKVRMVVFGPDGHTELDGFTSVENALNYLVATMPGDYSVTVYNPDGSIALSTKGELLKRLEEHVH